MRKDLLRTAFFALFVAGVFLVTVFEIKDFQKEVEVKEINEYLVRLSEEELESFEFGDVRIQKIQGNWQLKSPYFDFLNFESVDAWAAKALARKAKELSKANEEVDWAEFGFTEGVSKEIKFTTKNLKSVKLKSSAKKAFDGSLYVKVKRGAPKTKTESFLMAAEEGAVSIFDVDLKDFELKELFDWSVPSAGEEVVELHFWQPIKNYKLIKKDGAWASPDKKNWTFDSAKLESSLDDIKKFLYRSKKIKFDLKSYKKVLKLRVNLKGAKSYSVEILEAKSKTYAKVSFRPDLIFEVDSSIKSLFYIDPWDIRSFADALNIDDESISQFSIKRHGETQYYSNKNGEWKTASANIPKGHKLNGGKILKYFDELKKLNFTDYISRSVSLGETKYRLNIKYKNGRYFEFKVGDFTSCDQKTKWKKDCYKVRSGGLQLILPKKDFDQFLKEQTFFEELKAPAAKEG